MDSERENPEVDRARELLDVLLRHCKINRHQLDRKMGQGNGFTSQLLIGRVKLRLEHVLQLLGALGVPPSVFFASLYPLRRQEREEFHGWPGLAVSEPEPAGGDAPMVVDGPRFQRAVEKAVDKALARYFPDLAEQARPRRRR